MAEIHNRNMAIGCRSDISQPRKGTIMKIRLAATMAIGVGVVFPGCQGVGNGMRSTSPSALSQTTAVHSSANTQNNTSGRSLFASALSPFSKGTRSNASQSRGSDGVQQASAIGPNGGSVQTAGHQQPPISNKEYNRNAVQPAQYGMPHPAQCPCGMHGDGIYRPVLPAIQAELGGVGCLPESCAPANCATGTCLPGYDPQEYLYDGGDRLPRVVVQNDGTVVGLQPEDTVAQFELDSGKVCVEPACRAAIYAPRFAAVRKIVSTSQSDCVLAAKATLRPEGTGVILDELPSPSIRQPIGPGRENSVKRIESFKDRNRGTPLEKVLPIENLSDAFMPFEDIQLLRHGRWDRGDLIKLQRGVQAALAWGTAEELQVLINEKEPLVKSSVKGAAETLVYELNGKPRIRICKVASQQVASPGDEIHFTIRVDNVGEQEVKNVVVLDSLAPRLEFVEGSQQSSLELEFDSEDNEAGSKTLRWKCKKALKAGEGGVIRFRCRVR